MQLFVEGKDLVDLDIFTVSDPMCTLKTRNSNKDYDPWILSGETEVIDNNLNPKWIQHFTVGYMFQKDIDLWFQVWNVSDDNESKKDLIGEANVTLSEIMQSKTQEVKLILQLPTND